ncbi:hypothetical protein D6B98_15780 [Bradyrhizobium sp. LVM 105]|nr:hypothetical protein D6B98_15780 [Bradyrhizobium sp. LVM 105]
MTRKEAEAISGRSESWLKSHTCAWCDQILWRALRYGCGAVYEKCDPSKKDFSPAGKPNTAGPRSGTAELSLHKQAST